MKITIIFPGCEDEAASNMSIVMPPALTLLAALTPAEHEVRLVDMFNGDEVDADDDTDLVGITVRTPLAMEAYQVADRFLARGKKVVLGGPHTFAFPQEAKRHASAVAIGEGETLWPRIIRDAAEGRLMSYYVCGPYVNGSKLPGTVVHEKQRPSLAGLPMLRRDLLPRRRYLMDSIFTTRGCPNQCRFCSVTRLFGGKIRHRPIDEVVAEVSTLGERYYNVDDSVFGHPQAVGQEEENQYYLDLYRELASLRPKRLWTGAGGLAAVSYKDGRKILELAAQSGLSSIWAGLESITASGQVESGAWRKLHCTLDSTLSEVFDLRKMKRQIREVQSLGIEIIGFFIVGWDDDTVETYARTLDFCDECNIVPFILTLLPMPGSPLYDEYLAQDRIFTELPWDRYGSSTVVYRHPTMSPEAMLRGNAEVMEQGYRFSRIIKRVLHTAYHRRSLDCSVSSFFIQLELKRAYRRVLG